MQTITPNLFNALHSDFQPLGSSTDTGYLTHSVASTIIARDSIEIGRPHFFNGGIHLDFWVLQWSKIVANTKQDQKNDPQLKLLHSTRGGYTYSQERHSPRNRDTLNMRCMKVSGALGSSRRQPEMSHEVIS